MVLLQNYSQKTVQTNILKKIWLFLWLAVPDIRIFSTDTATVLRAIEIEAETIFLAKAIDGVYDSDPKTNPEAKKYDEVSIDEVIAKNLQVVDMTASILCRDNKMPMLVFGLNEKDSIVNTAHGIFTGTKVLV